jgi:hypothetical protein
VTDTKTTTQCNSETEKNCTQQWTMDDGVPYCDTCGYYRNTVHRKQLEAERQRKRK